MNPAVPQTRSRVADIWRALACLGVVFFHGSNSVGDTHPWLESLTDFFGHSGPRLSIFFVVAGYCLALSAERRSAAASSALDFFRKRFLRIYPVYWAALGFALVLGTLAAPFNGRPLSEVFPATPQAWLAELTLTQHWLDQGSTLVVAWFLNHLVALSLVFGVALAVRSVQGRLALYVIVTALAHAPTITAWLPSLALWPHFACGVALAFAFPSAHSPARPALLLYPLALGLLGLGRGDSFLVYSACVTALFGLCLRHRDRLPSAPPALLAIATASYSIYLVHVPVMSPTLNLIKRLVPAESYAFVAAWIVHLGLGVGAGLLFHRLVEAPLQHLLTPSVPAPAGATPRAPHRWIDKLLRAGRPERASRLHTGTGQRVPLRRWPHLALSLASWLRLRLGRGCAVRPWLSYAAVRRLAALLPRGLRAGDRSRPVHPLARAALLAAPQHRIRRGLVPSPRPHPGRRRPPPRGSAIPLGRGRHGGFFHPSRPQPGLHLGGRRPPRRRLA
ncbi:MAG: acyltransferase [Burkholderiales bacterium]|nr:acyltransferase [Opitutaceae bacterium]